LAKGVDRLFVYREFLRRVVLERADPPGELAYVTMGRTRFHKNREVRQLSAPVHRRPCRRRRTQPAATPDRIHATPELASPFSRSCGR
jgi:hypothetical protein